MVEYGVERNSAASVAAGIRLTVDHHDGFAGQEGGILNAEEVETEKLWRDFTQKIDSGALTRVRGGGDARSTVRPRAIGSVTPSFAACLTSTSRPVGWGVRRPLD